MKNNKALLLLMLVLIVLIIIFSLTTEYFLTLYNFKNILSQSVINIILGIGMTFVICTAGIDLSVGSVAAFSSVILALALKMNMPVIIAILLGILAGGFAGFINGYLISILKVNHFITTLATMSIWRAMTLILTKSSPIYGFPESFTKIGIGSIGNIPIAVIICTCIVLIGYILFSKTKLGYYCMALGSNEEALKRTGVSVEFYKTTIYIICAITAAIAGLIMSSKLNCADPLAGTMMEMEAITIVILGGTSIKGGKATILGTVVAGLLMSVLKNGLTLNSIATYYQQLITGIILILAVVTSEKLLD